MELPVRHGQDAYTEKLNKPKRPSGRPGKMATFPLMMDKAKKEDKITMNTGFKKVSGGYEKRTSETTKIFIPDMCAKSFDETTGAVEMYTPKYEEKEPAKPAEIGINAYQYETQEAPNDCDFELTIGHYGDNYLTPLKDGLILKGRGIKWLDRWYRVTDLALEKLEKQYKIKYEMMFD